MTIAIWITLVILSIFFIYVLSKDVIKHRKVLENISVVKTALIGFIVNFFDVLGIGAFAPQTALLKFTKQTEDRILPGTLNVSNTIPVLIQALIFIQIVEVEPVTLISMLLSAAAGAILGAGIVAKLPVRKIQLTMGFALLVTAFFMLSGQMNWIQNGGEAIGLSGGEISLSNWSKLHSWRLYDRRNWFVRSLYGLSLCFRNVTFGRIPNHDGFLCFFNASSIGKIH